MALNPNIWQNNNLNYNLLVEDMLTVGFDLNNNPIVTDNYGYPHLEHPTNHFTKTPFEAVYADVHIYDHIKMKETVEKYGSIGEVDLGRIRNFLLDEVESWDFPLQNKVIGLNHVIDPNYTYKAWYKARGAVRIGRQVTTKTKEGDFIIQSTGDITVYGGAAVDIKPGFHAQNGSTFHAFIQPPDDCLNGGDNGNKSVESSGTNTSDLKQFKNIEDSVDSSEEIVVELYPNPNTGHFNFIVHNSAINAETPNNWHQINQELAKPNGILYVYTLGGQIVHQQNITEVQTLLSLNLEKGLYIVAYKSDSEWITLKMTVQ